MKKKLVLVVIAGAMGLFLAVAAFASGDGGVEKNRFHKVKCSKELQGFCKTAALK